MDKAQGRDLKISSSLKLTDKESKRTTFKLSRKSLNALAWMGESFDVTVKEIFDVMCSENDLLNIAVEQTGKEEKLSNEQWVRKTFVISQHSLRLLNKKSESEDIIRDSLVNKLILIYELLLKKQMEEEERNEKEALEIISSFWEKAENAEKELAELLGNDHPILSRFGKTIITINNLVDAIESKLTEGTPIDPDDL